MATLDDIIQQVDSLCPNGGVADHGILTPQELDRSQSNWTGAIWVTLPDGHVLRVDALSIATPSERSAAQQYLDGLTEITDAAAPRLVRKALIVDRLHGAGLLVQALAALNSSDVYTQQRWLTRDSVYYNDPTLVAALTAIGANVDAIMAPDV